MTGASDLFTSYTPCPSNSKVKIADGSLSTVAGKGSIKLSNHLTINSVLHVPNLTCNLLSVNKLTLEHNCVAKFFPSMCQFQEISSGRTIGSARMSERLYFFDEEVTGDRQALNFGLKSVSVSSDREIMLWHQRFGHPNFLYLKTLF
ncbi:hypothetical protein Pfo_006767, partial [Paulownia fortunei]